MEERINVLLDIKEKEKEEQNLKENNKNNYKTNNTEISPNNISSSSEQNSITSSSPSNDNNNDISDLSNTITTPNTMSSPQFSPPSSLFIPKKYEQYQVSPLLSDNLPITQQFMNNNYKNQSYINIPSNIQNVEDNKKHVTFKDPIDDTNYNVNRSLMSSFNQIHEDQSSYSYYNTQNINRIEKQNNMIKKEKIIEVDNDFTPYFL